MSKVYNKLVRDNIPEIIQAEGKVAKTRQLSGEEYLQALLQKLQEECDECKANPSLEELADVQEVIFALAEELGSTREQLELVQLDKLAKRGGFRQKIFLEEVE